MRATSVKRIFAIGRVSCSADSFVVVQVSVILTTFCADKPTNRQSVKRYAVML